MTRQYFGKNLAKSKEIKEFVQAAEETGAIYVDHTPNKPEAVYAADPSEDNTAALMLSSDGRLRSVAKSYVM